MGGIVAVDFFSAIYFYTMPVPVPVPVTSSFKPLIYLYLINLVFFIIITIIVFLAAKERGLITDVKKSGPYALFTVLLNVPIDLLYIFLAERFFLFMCRGIIPGSFFSFLSEGKFFSAGYGFKDLLFLAVPSLVAFALLFAVQFALMKYFFEGIKTRKRLIMSSIIAFLILPTWVLLVLFLR